MNTKDKLKLMKEIEQRNEQRRKEFRIMQLYIKGHITKEQMEALVSEIESEMQNSLHTEFSSRHIGVMVMERLKALDEVAYIRFASVHREFRDLHTFMQALEEMTKKKEEDKG
jgi:transcriptional regulator NrdR family protein